MTYILKSGDKNVIDNIRFKYKKLVKDFSDVCIAEAWYVFSQSEDYNAKDADGKYLEWLETIAMDITEDEPTNGHTNAVAALAVLTEPVRITRANIDDLLDRRMIEVHMKGGAWWEVRRNGKTQTWKSQPGRIRIPFKYGFKGYGAFTTWDFIKPNGGRMRDGDGLISDAHLDMTEYRVKPSVS